MKQALDVKIQKGEDGVDRMVISSDTGAVLQLTKEEGGELAGKIVMALMETGPAGFEAAELGRRMMQFEVAFVNDKTMRVRCTCGKSIEDEPGESTGNTWKRRIEAWMDEHEAHLPS